MSPSVQPTTDVITCAANGSDHVVSSCGIAVTPSHDPAIVGASTSIWGITVMLGHVAPGTGLNFPIGDIAPTPGRSTPATGVS
jgi:hypothetical protein